MPRGRTGAAHTALTPNRYLVFACCLYNLITPEGAKHMNRNPNGYSGRPKQRRARQMFAATVSESS
jgi:hypothetical protein